jgi:5-methylcytosine-specific restriction enzyme A
VPRPALRPCSYPGCPEIVTSGYCDKHRIEKLATSNDYHDQGSKHLYNSKKWQIIRKNKLINQPWCEECLRANPPIYTPATDVDHIDPHRGDIKRFFNGPFQSLCKECHSRKTASEVNERGAGQKSTTWSEKSVRGR